MTLAEKTIYTEELYSIKPCPTVLLSKPWTLVGDMEKELLIKILVAVKLSLDKVTVKYQDTFDLSSWQNKPSKLVYFGPMPAGIPYYEVIDVNGVSLVASESLENLIVNDPSRKRLWEALQQLFPI